jgi:hypothetical protein
MEAGWSTMATRIKNGQAWAARRLGEASGGSIVLGADLDVLAAVQQPGDSSLAQAEQSG